MNTLIRWTRFFPLLICFCAPACYLISCQRNCDFVLTVDKKPFFIKGAGGYSHLDILRQSGGNAIRTWDTLNLAQILDSAQHHGLKVMAGIYIVDPLKSAYFYEDTMKVNSQFRSIKKTIDKYKKHPSLLMWCVGNELNFPNSPFAFKFYSEYNRIINMVHQNDLNHPVTTAVWNFSRKAIINLRFRTNIDILSFNIYNKTTSLKDELKGITWFWNGPYLLSEWGIDGPWEGSAHTIWGSYIEPTSTKKAEIYAKRYLMDMPIGDPRFLGSFVFYWGNKQEFTHTWFSLFDENGAQSEAVAKLRYIWKKEGLQFQAPQINFMLVNNKGAADNILLAGKSVCSAKVDLLKPIPDGFRIVWQLFPEDWYKRKQNANKRYLKPIEVSFHSVGDLAVSFTVPQQEGPYRLFATIYDKHGNFSTCNTPFYVLKK
jgi:hypothetical protein